MDDSSHSWSLCLILAFGIIALAYLLGWSHLSSGLPRKLNAWHAPAFVTGQLLGIGAFASPALHLDQYWLTAHMLQHLILMTIAAPLILVAEPAMILLNSAPRLSRTGKRFFLHSSVRGNRRGLIEPGPVLCWLAGNGCVLVWHVPRVFALCMRSSAWHMFELGTFFATGLLFWCPVIQPWPISMSWPRWFIPLYLFTATIPCDVLSAFLTFCGRVVYPTYAPSPLVWQSALADQERAGAMMWTWVTFIYLLPAVIITTQLLTASDGPARSITLREGSTETHTTSHGDGPGRI